VDICLERGADLHTAQLMPLPLTVSCFSKIQIGFTFLVPAHTGSPGQRAVKRVCVCVWPQQNLTDGTVAKNNDQNNDSAVADGPARRAPSSASYCRQVDGQCDKLTADRRKYCKLSSADDGPVYRIKRPHLSSRVDDSSRQSTCRATVRRIGASSRGN